MDYLGKFVDGGEDEGFICNLELYTSIYSSILPNCLFVKLSFVFVASYAVHISKMVVKCVYCS